MSSYFRKEEMEVLLEIKKRIHEKQRINFILEISNRAGNFKENFPSLYSAILLATHGRREQALSLYNSGKLKHPFADEFFRYLKKNGTVEPKVTVFKTSLPYDAWVKTNLFKIELENTLKTIGAFFESECEDCESVSILDIGPGNGRMTAQLINHILRKRKIKRVNLVLLDKFPAMLEAAKNFCEETIRAEIKVETICCPAQSLDEDNITKLNSHAPFWTTICSRSIHHMPSNLKLDLLRKLKCLTKSLILVEMNSTHDLPEKDSPDLIYSIAKSYGFIFNDINNSPLTKEEKLAAIDDFLLAEALFMIGKERADRIDYHATIDEWSELSSKAGFKIDQVEASAPYPDGEAHYFTMISTS